MGETFSTYAKDVFNRRQRSFQLTPEMFSTVARDVFNCRQRCFQLSPEMFSTVARDVFNCRQRSRAKNLVSCYEMPALSLRE
jgi:hypothetical protein